MLFAIGFLFTFLLGGLTGVFLASPPIDFATHDTYFVVAHFHSVAMALVMAGMAGIYFWYPKITGRMLREGIGKLHFWLMFVGSQVTFLPQYVLGLHGMPRRIATYPVLSWVTLNQWSTAGSVLIALSVVVFVVNYYVSWRKPVPASADPWGGHALEWWTTSPPPHHNFVNLPLIRSERPTWDAHNPDHRTIPHASRGKTHHDTPALP